MKCHWIHISVISCSINDILNIGHYISVVLRPVAAFFVQALRNITFQQGIALQHVADIVRIFLDTKNVRLLSWPEHSPDLSPAENVCWMIVELLGHHHTPLITIDELCRRTWWNCMGSCTCTCHPVFVRVNALVYDSCFWWRRLLYLSRQQNYSSTCDKFVSENSFIMQLYELKNLSNYVL